MMRFILGVLVGIILIPVFVFFYFKMGYAPAATSAAPWPFEARLAHMALNARVDAEAPKASPVAATESNLLAGAKLYREHCAMCHGLKNQPAPSEAAGMYPRPPQLLKGKGVTDDPPGETYWKVANGIRLTGMPAYSKVLTTEQMWQISQLMATADKMPASVDAVVSQPLVMQ